MYVSYTIATMFQVCMVHCRSESLQCRGVHVECIPSIHDPRFLSTPEL